MPTFTDGQILTRSPEPAVEPNPWLIRMARLATAAVLLGADSSGGVCLLRLRTPPEPGIVGSGRPIGWRLVTGDGRASDFRGRSLAALDDVDAVIHALLTGGDQGEARTVPTDRGVG